MPLAGFRGHAAITTDVDSRWKIVSMRGKASEHRKQKSSIFCLDWPFCTYETPTPGVEPGTVGLWSELHYSTDPKFEGVLFFIFNLKSFE